MAVYDLNRVNRLQPRWYPMSMGQTSTVDTRNGHTELGRVRDAPTRPALIRRYVGAAGHQTHLLEGGADKPGRPLYCLHATAYSGRSFSPFLELMASRRRVVAIDAPGYGASDGPSAPINLAGYARAIDAALDAAGEGEVDLFGYHTGALIAAELARQRPDRVRRLILIGVPYFSGLEQSQWRERLAEPMRLSEDFDQFRHRWNYFVTDRPPGVGLPRGFENFVDELRAYPNAWWAHDAAFTFDVESCFAQVTQSSLVLNPQNHLSEASRQAAQALAHCRLVEMLNLKNGIFDVASDDLVQEIDAFLSERVG